MAFITTFLSYLYVHSDLCLRNNELFCIEAEIAYYITILLSYQQGCSKFVSLLGFLQYFIFRFLISCLKSLFFFVLMIF